LRADALPESLSSTRAHNVTIRQAPAVPGRLHAEPPQAGHVRCRAEQAGKSNAARLLTVSQRAIEASDGSAREVARQLAASLQARRPPRRASRRDADHLPAHPGARQRPAAAARGGASWSSSDLALVDGAEAWLPEFLKLLKNGNPAERARYRRVQELFQEFTQGRKCELRLMQVPHTAQDGQLLPPSKVPAMWVTISADGRRAAPQPPAPAWRIPVRGAARFLVITHSAELLPLADVADVQLVRLDRNDKNAAQARALDEACRRKMTQKLKAEGNERLPARTGGCSRPGSASSRSPWCSPGRAALPRRAAIHLQDVRQHLIGNRLSRHRC
jgi:hypothetical protein